MNGSSLIADLVCSSTLSSAAIDDPSLLSITWYHEETMIQSTSDTVLLNKDGTAYITNNLIIDPFTTSTVGIFRCVATIADNTCIVQDTNDIVTQTILVRIKCEYTFTLLCINCLTLQ